MLYERNRVRCGEGCKEGRELGAWALVTFDGKLITMWKGHGDY